MVDLERLVWETAVAIHSAGQDADEIEDLEDELHEAMEAEERTRRTRAASQWEDE